MSLFIRGLSGLFLFAALLACSPSLNWREVRAETGQVAALLPCKPDRATRTVPLGGPPTRLLVMGCEADGAMFVLSLADLGDVSRTAEVLGQWQTLTLSHMRAMQPQQSAVRVVGADLEPAPVLWVARGSHPDGQPVEGRALFFARGSLIVQAAVYANRVQSEAAETFFASIKLL